MRQLFRAHLCQEVNTFKRINIYMLNKMHLYVEYNVKSKVVSSQF